MKKNYLVWIFLVVLGISLISIFPSPSNSQSDSSPGVHLSGMGLGLVVYLICMAIFTVLFIRLATTTEILRDSSPNLPSWAQSLAEVKRQNLPYSLGRFQMGFWFVIIAGSFVFISLSQSNYQKIISEQSLILMGISAATALSSVAIGNSKVSKVEQDYNKLIEEQKNLQYKILVEENTISRLQRINPDEIDEDVLAKIDEASAIKEVYKVQNQKIDIEKTEICRKLKPQESMGFLRDILNDIDGLSLHRFQIFVWTIILGSIFVMEVLNRHAMPEFDNNLLALQGISAATYLGFKLPETKN